ncbi:acyl-CoA dehydratase activase-related protein [Dehalococcoidia bacterium]|nr:acyl-CoA dehydratase activase-related protein [Dehalococcoidia bacterium]
MKNPVIGVPRGLFYYRYFPFWKTFFEELGAEVVVSPPTDKKILDYGLRCLTDEICLPVKAFCGQVASLNGKCDFVLIPSIYCLEKKVYNCPKFIGLPDLIRAAIPEALSILDPDVDLDKGKGSFYLTLYTLGHRFTSNPLRIKRAIDKAAKSQKEFERPIYSQESRVESQESGEGGLQTPDSRLQIAVVSHPYLIHDEYINHRLVAHLEGMGAKVLFPEMIENEKLRASLYRITDRPYWTCEDEIIGAGACFAENQDVDGIISLNAFGCGPDSVMIDLVQNYARKFGKPFLQIVLDEHTSDTGLLTRLEAFLDTIRPRWVHGSRLGRGGTLNLEPLNLEPRIRTLGVPFIGGRIGIFKKLLKEKCDISLISPPVTARSIELGVKHSPEWVCFPFKVMLGTFIECLDQGADTLLITTSFNACRMGRYARVQEQILENLGYTSKFFKLHGKDKGLSGVARVIKRFSNDTPWITTIFLFRFGAAKLRVLDRIEREVQRIRARENEKGRADRVFEEAIDAIDEACTFKALDEVCRRYLEKLREIPQGRNSNPLRIGLVGELYVLIEPFANMNLERELGKMGVEVSRVRSTYLSEYTRFLRFDVLNQEKQKLSKFTGKYLKRDVGGHALESLGKKITGANEYDGLIHLMPFGCLPEIIAQNIMLKTEEKLPVLTIACDEKLGEAGLITRLEAFVDLLWNRRNSHEKTLSRH